MITSSTGLLIARSFPARHLEAQAAVPRARQHHAQAVPARRHRARGLRGARARERTAPGVGWAGAGHDRQVPHPRQRLLVAGCHHPRASSLPRGPRCAVPVGPGAALASRAETPAIGAAAMRDQRATKQDEGADREFQHKRVEDRRGRQAPPRHGGRRAHRISGSGERGEYERDKDEECGGRLQERQTVAGGVWERRRRMRRGDSRRRGGRRRDR